MKIQISPELTISDLQTAFLENFQYIKLVFFSKPHRAFKGSPAKFMIQDQSKTLRELVPDMKEGFITLEADTPTYQAEALFEAFGIHVQVFRKSGSLWLETSVTDKLTLEEQNEKGKASEQVHTKSSELSDYREQE